MSLPKIAYGQLWSATGADTNGGGITLTKAAGDTGLKHYVTDITVSGDAAALITLKDGTDGTILWQARAAAAFWQTFSFNVPFIGTAATAMELKISAGTTNTEATMQGFTAQ